MTEFHHGITARESAAGKIPIRNSDTNIMAMVAYADDADEDAFPLNTPVLVTSVNRVLPKAGAMGNLRKNLEIISAITSPTLVVIRIADPYTEGEFDQSVVIGTTADNGKRTGLQALLTVKSQLGITPKIICVSDTETIDVANALGAICKKLRAYSYITPRDADGVVFEDPEDVVNFRNMLAFREIELIWPEWTSGNVLLGEDTNTVLSPTKIYIQQTDIDGGNLTYDLYIQGNKIESNEFVNTMGQADSRAVFFDLVKKIVANYIPPIRVVDAGGGIGHFQAVANYVTGGNGLSAHGLIRIVLKRNSQQEQDIFPLFIDQDTGLPLASPVELVSLGESMFPGF
ncbi:hypothetical protein F946_03152 [Acinetobacter johnsonii ANC 3681]|uniref:Tail sheath protein subtilisin-like domain-containing protein n=1 Tax=Acinetobacter johnsonii ANC 3681 TaxID=1217662 RepID=N9CTB2_ACIJO|nr:hypothetical protein [Acinetobacter johnsonii]ENV71473.1 hypothetical protein F946_03152 [Acinetobacter johnsonii ANC 3681]